MSWHRLTLTADQLAAGALDRCKSEFEIAFNAAGAPRTAALFQKTEEGGDVVLLLTPDCVEHLADLLEKWGCTTVESPAMAGMELLVGFNEITYYIF